MAEIDRIKKIIIALMEKTVSNGCTEEEALEASRKAQELLHKYQLDLSDIEFEQAECRQGMYDTQWHKFRPIELVVTGIAYFTDTKVWKDTDKYRNIRFKYFGLDHDVLIAEYITKICDMAIIRGGERYIKTLSKGERAGKMEAFRVGMAKRLNERLREMKDAQKKNDIETTGRDLVVVKNAVVEDEFAKLGLHLGRGRAHSRSYDRGAQNAGRAEGDKVALNPGVGAQARRSIR